MEQLEEAGRRFGPIGVAGVYGVGKVIAPEDPTQPLGPERIGWVNDRGRVLRDGPELPARVATLDEIVLVCVETRTCGSIRSWDFIFMGPTSTSKRANKGWPWSALAAPCHHNSPASDCRRRFSRALGFSPANGATGCQWRRRASSSTKEVRFTCWETPWIGRDRLLSRSGVFVGPSRELRTDRPDRDIKSGLRPRLEGLRTVLTTHSRAWSRLIASVRSVVKTIVTTGRETVVRTGHPKPRT